MEFVQVYNNKSKFLKKYIDVVLLPNGKGDFIRGILFRTWRMLERKGFTRPGGINYDVIEVHLKCKFTKEEWEIILLEKKRKAELKKAAKGHEYREFYPADMPKDKVARLKLIEIIIMRHMGYNNDEIAREINYSSSRVGYIYNYSKRKVFKEDVQYLKNIVSCMIIDDGYTVECKYFVRRFTEIKIDWRIEKENDFSAMDMAKEKWRRIPGYCDFEIIRFVDIEG